MKIFTAEECDELKVRVAATVGSIIKYYREKKNISGEQLGNCLGVSGGMVSQYESGKADINLSKMALTSVYCGFPLSAYFEVSESRDLLNTFSRLVKIEGDKYKRHKHYKEQSGVPEKVLKARVYQVGDKEVIEKVPEKMVGTEGGFVRRDILYGEVVLEEKPFTEREFVYYLKDEENKDVCRVMAAIGEVLDYLGDAERKETVKSELTEFVLTELIVDKVMERNKSARRAYMYYRELLKNEIGEV